MLPTQANAFPDFKQQRLEMAVDQIATSNTYRTKAIVAEYIQHSLSIAGFATLVFTILAGHRALGGYNDNGAVSFSLLMASFIPGVAKIHFNEKITEFRSLSQTNIDLAKKIGDGSCITA